MSLYYLRLSFGHCIVSVLLRALVCSLYFHCTTYAFCLFIVLSLFYIRFRLDIVFSPYYLRLSYGHCIVSVLLTALVCSLCSLCTTYGFRLVIVLSLYYLRLSCIHYIVSVLFTAFLWPLYWLCTTYGSRLVIVLSLYYLRFRLVIVLSLCYLRLSLGHCIVSVLLKAFVWSLYCLCTT